MHAPIIDPPHATGRPALQAYQRRMVLAPRRMTWSNWARQAGKSFAFTLRRLLRGMCRGRTQLLLSAGARQSRELILKLREHCEGLTAGGTLRGRFIPRVTVLILPRGVRIIALPANPLTARGFTAD